MKGKVNRGALVLCCLLCMLLLCSAWAATPVPSIKPTNKIVTPTPKITPKPTPKPTPTPSANFVKSAPSMNTPTSLASLPPTSSTPKPVLSIPLVRARISFFNSETDTIKKVLKSFYWVSLPSGPRRFDAVLSPAAFRKNSVGKWVLSSDVVELTRKMAQRLYEDEEAKVVSYFGQYEPDIFRNEIRLSSGISEGVDFTCIPQDAVFHSLTAGVVVKVVSSDDSDEYSYCAVRTPDNKTVFYVYGVAYFVKEGDTVEIGTPLGRQGDRGSKGMYQVHVSVSEKDAQEFARNCDTKLTNGVPYVFWEKWMLEDAGE